MTLWQIGTCRRRMLGPLVIATALVTGGCGDSSDRSTESEPESIPPTTVDEGGGTDQAVDRRNGVELIDAGAAPREELMLEPVVGAVAERVMVAEIGITVAIDGEELPSPTLPATRLVLRSVVEDVDEEGTITSTFTLVDAAAVDGPGVDPAVLAEVETALNQMDGLTGTGTTDRHGGSPAVSIDTGTITDPALRSTLDSLTSQLTNLTAPLPAQPVGVGSSWRADRSATLNGVQTDTSTTYTLQARSGNAYALGVVQEATAPRGPAQLPGLPAGVTASIESFLLRSTGEVRGRLDQPLPDNSTIQGGGDIELTVEGEGEAGRLSQRVTVDASLATEE